MNKEETLALYAQGKDAWNAWANAMLAEKKRLEESGEWAEKKEECEKRATVDFEEHEFKENIEFFGFIFPGHSVFDKAKFHKHAWFKHCVFYGKAQFGETNFLWGTHFERTNFSSTASFGKAKFLNHAMFLVVNYSFVSFEEAVFYKDAAFIGSTFTSDAIFGRVSFHHAAYLYNTIFLGNTQFTKAIFHSMANFTEASFSSVTSFKRTIFNGQTSFFHTSFAKNTDFSYTLFHKGAAFNHARFKYQVDFNRAVFKKDVNFYGLQSEGGFDLLQAQFAYVPGFNQAYFKEPPRLDDTQIPEQAPPEQLKELSKESKTITARYRALKRMAIQAHDHKREQDFFAGELKSMRGNEHLRFNKNWGWYWAGRAYEEFSNFGRSPLRVLEWMFIQSVVFLYVYLFMGGVQGACVSGEGNRFWSAFYLSLGKTLFPFGVASTEKTTDYLGCLYGHTRLFGEATAPFVAAIPAAFSIVSLIQSLFSLLLIFLLLLAVRAHFRVK